MLRNRCLLPSPAARRLLRALCAASPPAPSPEAAQRAVTLRPRVHVVAAGVLLSADGQRVLLAQRPAHKSEGGKWEFPGGKVEAGEQPDEACARELLEELDLVVQPSDLTPLSFATLPARRRDAASAYLLMLVFVCSRWQREPRGAEGQLLRWVTAAELGGEELPMPDLDTPLLPVVRAAMEAQAAKGQVG
jgi:8-oxo-dGTP diphosphatase